MVREGCPKLRRKPPSPVKSAQADLTVPIVPLAHASVNRRTQEKSSFCSDLLGRLGSGHHPGCAFVCLSSHFWRTMPDRFVVDEMLGRLARWLRVLGYDTVAPRPVEDVALVRLAMRDGRVLLTRDTLLMQRRPVVHGELRAILVRHDHLVDQLRQLMDEFGLVRLGPPRCLLCNAPLEELPWARAERLVPPYVAQTQRAFRRCPSCGRVFWPGTHWERMERVLREVGLDSAWMLGPGRSSAAASESAGRPAPGPESEPDGA